MTDITTEKIDEVYMRVNAPHNILKEIYDYFTLEIPNAHFNPKVKAKLWDGKIRYFHIRPQRIYTGLWKELDEFAKQSGYSIEHDDAIVYHEEFSRQDAKDFMVSLDTGFSPHEHQVDAFYLGVRDRRLVLDSATSSGKSFVIYSFARFFEAKTLVIVPTIQLCHQMASDFEEYSVNNGWDSNGNVHQIYQGQSKDTDKMVVVSTYHSITKMPKEWFDQFDVVIGDEAHQFKAVSLKEIMEKLDRCEYRIGTTGSVHDDLVSRYTIQGLFGPIADIIRAKEMIDKGLASKLTIKPIVMSYPDEERKELKKSISPGTKRKRGEANSYQKEIDFLIEHDRRNRFIARIAGRYANENFLVLFNNVEKGHGKKIAELVRKMYPDRKVHYVSGEVDSHEREKIRKVVEMSTGNVIVASLGTFSTGINIKNLHKALVAHPFKAKIRLMQSLGRMMRIHESKDGAVFFEIVDNLKVGKWMNPTYKHFIERMKIYNHEGHEVEIKKITI